MSGMAPKVPPMSYREAARFLTAHGFREARQAGSHVLFRHPDGRSSVVPRHGRDLDPRLVAKVLRDAGIDAAEARR